ncbi:MAG: hypothetical protein LBH39_04490 [Clostridiales Family XIII bacterium]|nr:hypothetical protein [Clostridiales Family XIII bacterium]
MALAQLPTAIVFASDRLYDADLEIEQFYDNEGKLEYTSIDGIIRELDLLSAADPETLALSMPAVTAENATFVIEEPEVPLYGPAHLGEWALANLIVAIISLTASMIAAITIMVGRTGKKRGLSVMRLRLRAVGIAVGVLVPPVFFVLEDIREVMQIFNGNTLLMAALLAAQMAFIRYSFRDWADEEADAGHSVGRSL